MQSKQETKQATPGVIADTLKRAAQDQGAPPAQALEMGILLATQQTRDDFDDTHGELTDEE
ncbi:hypothetical protein A2363_04305 [Candidatus Gottesmanbacteria bacterium RIFOXYB1_FULL_47_11]|uniref:Uncharacterized protein n=1 Tax=Candidatus Gottesmanbacteria bacterium RIFOXYB1_FULL_47_11 TaxID=1798401 RepID=A0A1F6BCC7_9BACT|nr:MAG: hypothetical protein A2363_04305 [Candidatus Gottesmanbacteria bacterium RIFOXYB1_FULL_47_11]